MLLGRITLYLLLAAAVFSMLAIASRGVYVPLLSTVFEGVPEHGPATVSASAWGLFDPETGRVLAGEGIDTPYPIASVTKLFTAHAVYQSGALEQEAVITWNDLSTDGRAGKLRHGSRLTLRELLFPLLIESSNDAGAAIARVLGPSFAAANDTLAHSLELRETEIVEPTGLSAGNVSTVRELARTFAHLRRESAHTLDITRLTLYLNGTYGWRNNNPAQEDARFRGGKHGFTEEAGRTLLAQFDIGTDGTERLVGVVLLGSNDIRADLDTVLRYAAEAK